MGAYTKEERVLFQGGSSILMGTTQSNAGAMLATSPGATPQIGAVMHSDDTPNTTEYTTEDIDPLDLSFGDVMPIADDLFAKHKNALTVIMYALLDTLRDEGPLHGMSVFSVCESYSGCLEEIVPAAFYMRDRGLINLDMDGSSKSTCNCASCISQRAYISLPYKFGADKEILIQQRSLEAERAQREAQHIVNQNRRDQGYVYLVKCGPRYKIGITRDMNRRMDQLRGQSPYPLEVVHHAKGHHNAGKESTLHKRYGDSRKHGEWFEFSPDQVSEIIEDLNEWSRESDK